MKHQALFSSKVKSKKTNSVVCCNFLFCALSMLRVKIHRRRKLLNIGWVGGGGGGGGGEKVKNNGGGKLFAGCKLIGAPPPNQCQIITFLTLKTDNIAQRNRTEKYTFRNIFT